MTGTDPIDGSSSRPAVRSNALRVMVGVAAITAPVLHTLSDVVEWQQGGFSAIQLWLNYVAFLPMPWLLIGIHAVHERDLGVAGAVGSVLYGIAFTYFAHSTLYALTEAVPNYEALWQRLGSVYTVHGAVMVAGGLVFALAVLRAGELPRFASWLFATGLLLNLVLASLPLPDMSQMLGTAIRNAGLVAMGCAILSNGHRRSIVRAGVAG